MKKLKNYTLLIGTNMKTKYVKCPDEECFNNAEVREIRGKKYTDCSECKQLLPFNSDQENDSSQEWKDKLSDELKRAVDSQSTAINFMNCEDFSGFIGFKLRPFIQSLLTAAREEQIRKDEILIQAMIQKSIKDERKRCAEIVEEVFARVISSDDFLIEYPKAKQKIINNNNK